MKTLREFREMLVWSDVYRSPCGWEGYAAAKMPARSYHWPVPCYLFVWRTSWRAARQNIAMARLLEEGL